VKRATWTLRTIKPLPSVHLPMGLNPLLCQINWVFEPLSSNPRAREKGKVMKFCESVVQIIILAVWACYIRYIYSFKSFYLFILFDLGNFASKSVLYLVAFPVFYIFTVSSLQAYKSDRCYWEIVDSFYRLFFVAMLPALFPYANSMQVRIVCVIVFSVLCITPSAVSIKTKQLPLMFFFIAAASGHCRDHALYQGNNHC